ncbi:DUF732 domain-containing protein [Mycobacterium sp. OTB74]|uniref:DUF732 domain-containing protein n=1 Tax=Mycobacterium sp. OTB74 TaxID=1853452 RepID=UPI0024759DC7|nr:DUF732 domain-containing protein [Mycobacterium sp. OTB74]MDH6245426.1 hypothetical protein [Mycobacterium sp. OTB74]
MTAVAARPVSHAATRPVAVTVSPRQQDYLDAVHAAGLRPFSDLMALRIGSSVCQARAAGQSDQAVRGFVEPLVREASGRAQLRPIAGGDATTADYIRIATDRLC